MFRNLEGTMYFVNQVVFFILLGLFFLVGLKVANQTIRSKKENRKGYISVMLSVPFGFIVSFFVIDTLPAYIDTYRTFRIPYPMLSFWIIVTLVGGVLSLLICLFVIKKEERRR